MTASTLNVRCLYKFKNAYLYTKDAVPTIIYKKPPRHLNEIGFKS